MPRRVSLPAADELFRSTAHDAPRAQPDPPRAAPAGRPADRPAPRAARQPAAATAAAEAAVRRPSGRVRHDEKMTVYVTSAELLGLEHARLVLRSEHGLAVDRGRLVREAIAIVLADFDLNGADSVIVQRLNES